MNVEIKLATLLDSDEMIKTLMPLHYFLILTSCQISFSTNIHRNTLLLVASGCKKPQSTLFVR